MNKPQYLIVHHTGGTDANPLADTSHHTFEIVDDYHKSLWKFKSSLGHYIGYRYFIDLSGKVTQGRADTDDGAHTIGYNSKSLGICLAGNFDATMPSQAQITALTALLKQKMAQYSIAPANIVPHRHFASKTCFGKKLGDSWASDLVSESNEASNAEIKAKIAEHASAISTLASQLKP